VPPLLAATCAKGTRPSASDTRCVPIGAPCPAGAWPENLPSGVRALYVANGGTGDGSSPSAPLGSIAAAVAKAGAMPTVVALAKGTFTEEVTLTGPVTLWGACAAGTTVAAPSPDEVSPTVTVFGDHARLVNLSITGPRIGVQLSAVATLEGVEIHDAAVCGLLVNNGATATLSGVSIHDVASRPSDRQLGEGVQVSDRASLTFTGGAVERTRMVGIVALDADARVELTDVVVRDTDTMEADGSLGAGVTLQDGASGHLTRVVLERNHTAGVLVGGAAATLEDVVVRGTRTGNADTGQGLYVHTGGTAEVRRGLFDDNQNAGVYVRGSDAGLFDVAVHDTQEAADGTQGLGVVVVDDAHVTLEGGVLEGNRSIGLDVEGSTVGARRLVIRRTVERSFDQLAGWGVQVDNARLDLDESVVELNQQHGVMVGGASSVFTLIDSWVTDTAQGHSPYGHGLGCQTPCRCDVQGSLVAFNAGAALLYSKARGVVESTVVLGNGVGIHAQLGSTLEQGWPRGATPDAGVVGVSDDTRFLENVTRIGTGTLPLPSIVAAPSGP
jgi:hypothetical protein